MKVHIITPYEMQWIDGYLKVFPDSFVSKKPDENGWIRQADVRLFMWLNEDAVNFINTQPKNEKWVVFVRRYEYFTNAVELCDWKKIDAVIMVNDELAEGFHKRTNIIPFVIYNGIDPDKWTFRERKHGGKVAWVGYINQKKNLPLALQVLTQGQELHIAGGVQDGQVMDYLYNIAADMKIRVIWNGQIPHSEMDRWLEDKSYILSTAISEGCPNNVIEAMAKGIKPIVHNWPGAKQQFGGMMFNTIEEARGMMAPGSEYDSSKYRNIAEMKFGMSNYKAVRELICRI